MTVYSLDASRMMAVVGELDGINRRIREMLTSLEETTRSSMADWTSEAKNEYLTCKARWDASAARMPHLLATASQVVPQVIENYRRGDQQGAGLWGNSAGRA